MYIVLYEWSFSAVFRELFESLSAVSLYRTTKQDASSGGTAKVNFDFVLIEINKYCIQNESKILTLNKIKINQWQDLILLYG